MADTDAAGTILSGGVWLAVSAVLPSLQTLLISVVAARFLGAGGFGEQSLIAFVSLSCSTIFAARAPAALQRFGAQLIGAGELGALHWLYRWTWRAQVACAILVAIGFGLAVVFGEQPALAWLAAGAATAFVVLQNGLGGLLTAAQRWRESVLPGTIITLSSLIVLIIVFAAGGGIGGYFSVEAVLGFASLIWTSRLAQPLLRELPPPERISRELRADFRNYMRTSTFFALVEFVVLSRVEVLFLDHYSDTREVGFYSVAFAASAAVARIPNVITTVAIPAVATLHGAGEHERVQTGYWRALRLLAGICPVLVALAAVLGSDLIGIAYGSEFHTAEPVLVILLIPYLILPMTGLSQALLWTLRRMRFLVVCGSVAVVADIALAFALIPSLHAVGAGIVNDGALLVGGIPTLWAVGRILAPTDLNWPTIGRSLLVAIISGAVSAVPIVLLPQIPGVVIGILLGAGAVWVTGTRIGLLGAEDAAWLADALSGRLGGRADIVRRFGVDGPARELGGIVLRHPVQPGDVPLESPFETWGIYVSPPAAQREQEGEDEREQAERDDQRRGS